MKFSKGDIVVHIFSTQPLYSYSFTTLMGKKTRRVYVDVVKEQEEHAVFLEGGGTFRCDMLKKIGKISKTNNIKNIRLQ